MRLGDLIPMTRTHALRGIVFRHLRDAVYAIPLEEKSEQETAMRSKLQKEGGHNADEIEVLVLKSYDKMIRRTRRVIPPPKELLASTQKVYELFENQVDVKTGEPLFSQKVWDAVKQGEKHIIDGCLPDSPLVDLYFLSLGDNGGGDLHCARGTSALEGWHKWLRRSFQGTTCSPANTLRMLLGKVHWWNSKIAISRRGVVDHGTHNTGTLLRLLHLDRSLGIESKYNMPDPDEFEGTGEHFGLSQVSRQFPCQESKFCR